MKTVKHTDDEEYSNNSLPGRLKTAIFRAGGASAISRASGVSLSTINDYLKGNEATFSRLSNIATACNVSLDWLATGINRAEIDKQKGLAFSKFGNALDEPAHFWSLLTLIRACREFYERTNKTPTLAEVFEWIAGPYQTGKELPDGPIEFKDPAHASRPGYD